MASHKMQKNKSWTVVSWHPPKTGLQKTEKLQSLNLTTDPRRESNQLSIPRLRLVRLQKAVVLVRIRFKSQSHNGALLRLSTAKSEWFSVLWYAVASFESCRTDGIKWGSASSSLNGERKTGRVKLKMDDFEKVQGFKVQARLKRPTRTGLMAGSVVELEAFQYMDELAGSREVNRFEMFW